MAALEALARMYALSGQYGLEVGVLERMLSLLPNDPVVMNNLAWVYYELGDARAYPLALRAYLATFDPRVADTLGVILLGQSRTREALELLRYAAPELPDLSVRLHVAQAARNAGLRDEARAMLEPLVKEAFDGHAAAVKLLGDIQAQR